MNLSDRIREGIDHLNKQDFQEAGKLFCELHEEHPINNTITYHLSNTYFLKAKTYEVQIVFS